MKKLLIGMLALGTVSANAITLKCKQVQAESNSQVLIENIGDSEFLGDNRVACYDKKDSTHKAGILIRGLGIGLRYASEESFTVKCPKAVTVNDLTYNQNGFFGGKFSVGVIGGVSVGIFKSDKESDLGTCYVFGSSIKTVGAGVSGAALTFWEVN